MLFAPGGHSPTGVFAAWCNVGTFVRLCFGVSCGIARARSSYAIMSVPVVAVAWPSCPGRRDVPGCGRRDVAVTSLDMAVARRGRGRGVRRLYVAVVWLRHADEC